MWFLKLKKKKVQYAVIGLMFLCITSIFTGCICFAVGMNEFSNTFYSKDTNPEFYYTSVGSEGVDALKEYAKESGEIKNLFIQNGKNLNTKLKINDQNITLFQSSFFAMEDAGKMPFFFQGKDDIKGLKQPQKGTVWISDVFADTKGVKAGDMLKIKAAGRELQFHIAGTYLTSICPSTSMAFYPFYLNPSDIEDMEECPDSYFTCLDKLDDTLDNNLFKNKLPGEFLNTISLQYDLEAIKTSLSSVTTLMAGIGSMASFLIFLVSIIIVRFIIKSNMAKEYKSIGIYKSLGFLSGKIIGFYYNCYLFTGFISILAGSLLGLPLSDYLGKLSIRYLGNYSISLKAFGCMTAGAGLLLVLLALNVYLSLRKVKKVNPVMALTMEMASSRTKFKKSWIKNAHSPLSMAVNDIFKKKNSSFLIILILTIAFYMSIFFSMTNYTVKNLEQNTQDWFSIPNTECFISMEMSRESQESIRKSKYVDQVTYGQLLLLLPVKMGNEKNSLANCSFFSYSDFSEEITGVKYRVGRAPKGTSEIAATTLALQEMQAEAGDYVTLTIDDKEKEFLISGQYDTMMNGGEGIQIPNAALDECSVAYKNDIGFVKLKHPNDYNAFKNEIKKDFPEADVTKSLGTLKDATKNVSEMVLPITTILVIIFMGFSFLNIVNLLLINNIENRKRFGILKALGFTDGYIILQNLLKIMILSSVGTVAALVLHISISRKLFQLMVSIDGLLNNIPLIAGLIVAMLAMVITTALIFTIPLRKIRPVDLMEE